eukprot:3029834-Prymnesium_polylepis.1
MGSWRRVVALKAAARYREARQAGALSECIKHSDCCSATQCAPCDGKLQQRACLNSRNHLGSNDWRIAQRSIDIEDIT